MKEMDIPAAEVQARSMSAHVVVDRPDRTERDLSVLPSGTLVKTDVCFWHHHLARVVKDEGPGGVDRMITIEKVLRDEQHTLRRSRVWRAAP